MEKPWKIHGKSTQTMDDLGLPPFILKRRSLCSSEAATEPWLHLQHHLRAWKAQQKHPKQSCETKLVPQPECLASISSAIWFCNFGHAASDLHLSISDGSQHSKCGLISDCRNSQGRWLLRPPTSTWNAFEVCAGLRRLGFCGVLPMGCACGMMIKPWYLGTVTALRVGMLVVRGYSVLFGRVAAKSLAQFCSLSAKFGCLEKRSSIYIYKYLYIYMSISIYLSIYI